MAVLELALGMGTVKICVLKGAGGPTGLVAEGKSRAGDILGASRPEAFRSPLDESCVSRPKVTAQEHNERRIQFGGKAPPESDRLLGGVSDGLARHPRSYQRTQYSDRRNLPPTMQSL